MAAMSKLENIHWSAPTFMLSSLVAGILFAVGHHCFYDNLNGAIASESFVLGSVTYQQVNIATGTALAFIVKSFLVFSVAIAFVQVFWKRCSEPKTSSPLKFGQLDVLYSGLDNALAFFHIRVWSKQLMLLGLCIIAWLLPVASIIMPATLSIRSIPLDVVATIQVPNLDFANFHFLKDMVEYPLGDYYYAGPRSEILSIVGPVLTGGSVLPMEPPKPNSTWVLEFSGPSLKCVNVSDTARIRFIENYVHANVNFSDNGHACSIEGFPYYAWSPGFDSTGPSDLPFLAHNNQSLQFSPGSLNFEEYSDWMSALTFYIMAIGFNFNPCIWNGNHSTGFEGSITKCSLFNSTYRVSFNYTEGEQRVSTEILRLDGEPQDSVIWVISMPWYDVEENIVRCSDLGDSTYLGYDGYEPIHNYLYTGSKRARVPTAKECGTFNHKLLERLSYQAIFDAFTSALKGTAGASNVESNWPSSVMQTVLIKTRELGFITEYGQQPAYSLFQQGLLELNDSNLIGLLDREVQTSDRPLAEALETLFRRVVVSLMSSSKLRSNYSSKFAPSPPNVTHRKYHNVYTYSAWKLRTAYGIAILFATIAVLIGLETMASSGVSYSDNFSTILRISRGADVSKPILDKDLDGKDPLPDYLAEAEVHFRLAGDS